MSRLVHGAFAIVGTVAGCSLASLDGLSAGDGGSCASPPCTGGSGATAGAGGIGAGGESMVAGAGGEGAGITGGSGGQGGQPPPFCANLPVPPTLCKDFDDGQSLQVGFDSVTEPIEDMVVLDTTFALSPPGSLSVRALASAEPDQTYANVYKQWDAVGSTFRVEFDLFHDAARLGGLADLVFVTFGPSGFPVVKLEVTPFEARVEQGYPGTPNVYEYDSLPAVPSQRWTRVAMVVDLQDGPVVTVSYDGAAVGAMDLDSSFLPGEVQLRLGLIEAQGLQEDLVVHYDNVVVDLQ